MKILNKEVPVTIIVMTVLVLIALPYFYLSEYHLQKQPSEPNKISTEPARKIPQQTDAVITEKISKATALHKSGEFEKAINEYQNALNSAKSVKDRAMAYNGIALVLISQGKMDEAEELLINLKEEKEDAAINITLGEINVKKMHYEHAVESYDKAAQKAPDNIQAYLGKGIALNRMYKYQDALAVFEKAEEIDKRHPDDDHKITYKAGKAAALFGLKEYDKSMKELNELLDEKDKNVSLYQIAFLMNDMEEFIMSMEAYKLLCSRKINIEDDKAFFNNPRERSDYYLTVGVLFSDHWEYEKAECLFDKAAKADPENYHVWIERGWNYFRLKQMDKAREQVTKWLDSKPKVREPEDLESFAIAWMIKGDYEKALDYIDQAIKVDPEWMDFYRRRAEINVLKGDLAKALEDYEYVKAKGLGDAQKDGAKMVEVLKEKLEIAN